MPKKNTFRKWADEARQLGWELLENIDGYKGLYRHLTGGCGHNQEIASGHMRKGNARCHKCDSPQVRWAEDAKARGWTFLRRVGDCKVLCSHDSCGHEQEIRADHLRDGRVRCQGCSNSLAFWQKSAAAHGWELLTKVNRQVGIFRHLTRPDGSPCGLELHAPLFVIKNNHSACACSSHTAGEQPSEAQLDTLDKWRLLASRQGWEMISRVERSKALFRHLSGEDGQPCLHEQVVTAHSFKKGKVQCQGCRIRLWQGYARAIGWELVARAEPSNAGIFRHMGGGCGHEQKIYVSQVKSGQVRCAGCQDPLQKWREEARLNGWELIEKIDRHTARYRHLGKGCGHEKICSAKNMRSGSARCDICYDLEAKWCREARTQGWEYVERREGNRSPRCLYRHADGCGHEQEFQTTCMRNGGVRCEKCGDPTTSGLHRAVIELLRALEVPFEQEVTLGIKPALTGRDVDGRARVDFLLQIGRRRVVLEIDGQQHFAMSPLFHSDEEDFRRQVWRDVFVEHEAVAEGCMILRFGSWEGITKVAEVIDQVRRGKRINHRLAQDMEFTTPPKPEYWAERALAMASYGDPDGSEPAYLNLVQAPIRSLRTALADASF